MTPLPSVGKNLPLAVLLSLCGLALFTPIFAAGKLSGGAVPALVLVWLRYLGGAMTLAGVVMVAGGPKGGYASRQWKLHFLRALFGVGGVVCTIYAGVSIGIGNTAAIGLTRGVMVMVLAMIFLRERVSGRFWVSLALSVVGAYFIVQSQHQLAAEGLVDASARKGIISAFLGAFFISCETILIRVLAQRENTLIVLGYVNVFAALVLTVPIGWLAMEPGVDWSIAAIFILLGPLAIIGQGLNIQALRRADAAALAPVSYFAIVFAALFGLVLFDERPDAQSILGAVLIVAAGLVITLPEFLKRQRARLEDNS